MFYLKVKDLEDRTKLLYYLKNNGILAVFHYVPLHFAPAGFKFCRFDGDDIYTTRESERLIRLPMYYGLDNNELEMIITNVIIFFKQ